MVKKATYIIFILTFLACYFTSFGQETKKEGEKIISVSYKKDTATVNSLLKIAKQQLSENNFNSCIENADKALTLSETVNYQEGLADALLIKGSAYMQIKSDLTTSRNYYNKREKLLKKLLIQKHLQNPIQVLLGPTKTKETIQPLLNIF